MHSPIKWVGGKARMAKHIIPFIPQHTGYIEVFGGAASVLFTKTPSKWEVLNDLDGNLMNFWDVVQNSYDELIHSFEYELVSRQKFNFYKQKYLQNDYIDNIERAKIFYYLNKSDFGADMKNPIFGVGKDRSRLRLEQIKSDIELSHERLIKVIIEHKNFVDIFKIYDDKNSFFYIDSPYRNTKQYITGKFTDEQYYQLCDCCSNAKGKWLYTINDDLFIRELFKEFNIFTQDVPYSISKNQNGRYKNKELIITNYNIDNDILTTKYNIEKV